MLHKEFELIDMLFYEFEPSVFEASSLRKSCSKVQQLLCQIHI